MDPRCFVSALPADAALTKPPGRAAPRCHPNPFAPVRGPGRASLGTATWHAAPGTGLHRAKLCRGPVHRAARHRLPASPLASPAPTSAFHQPLCRSHRSHGALLLSAPGGQRGSVPGIAPGAETCVRAGQHPAQWLVRLALARSALRGLELLRGRSLPAPARARTRGSASASACPNHRHWALLCPGQPPP